MQVVCKGLEFLLILYHLDPLLFLKLDYISNI